MAKENRWQTVGKATSSGFRVLILLFFTFKFLQYWQDPALFGMVQTCSKHCTWWDIHPLNWCKILSIIIFGLSSMAWPCCGEIRGAGAMVEDETFPSWVFVQMLKTYWLSVDPVVESWIMKQTRWGCMATRRHTNSTSLLSLKNSWTQIHCVRGSAVFVVDLRKLD